MILVFIHLVAYIDRRWEEVHLYLIHCTVPVVVCGIEGYHEFNW
jgi:hypothetical protein